MLTIIADESIQRIRVIGGDGIDHGGVHCAAVHCSRWHQVGLLLLLVEGICFGLRKDFRFLVNVAEAQHRQALWHGGGHSIVLIGGQHRGILEEGQMRRLRWVLVVVVLVRVLSIALKHLEQTDLLATATKQQEADDKEDKDQQQREECEADAQLRPTPVADGHRCDEDGEILHPRAGTILGRTNVVGGVVAQLKLRHHQGGGDDTIVTLLSYMKLVLADIWSR